MPDDLPPDLSARVHALTTPEQLRLAAELLEHGERYLALIVAERAKQSLEAVVYGRVSER
jgi:hypothetical protein